MLYIANILNNGHNKKLKENCNTWHSIQSLPKNYNVINIIEMHTRNGSKSLLFQLENNCRHI